MKNFFVGIELTRHCNLRCAHCFRADLDEAAEIPFETVDKVLREATRYNRPHIALTGGEPTLHHRFLDILNLIVTHGFTFHFVTNGYHYDKLFRKTFPLFGNPQWIGVSFSVDGAKEETHDAIRGKGSFARVLAAVAVAKTHKLEVVVQMVLHRGNRHELEALALLCSRLGVDRLHIAHMQPTPAGVRHNLLHSPEECRQAEREILNLGARIRMPVILSAGYYDESPLAHCTFLKNAALNIDYRGRLTTCCQLSNVEGSSDETDVIADLNEMPLEAAHAKLLEVYQGIFRARLEKIREGALHSLDSFHCWSCMKQFRKVEWMRDFPENAWVRQDPYFSRRRSS